MVSAPSVRKRRRQARRTERADGLRGRRAPILIALGGVATLLLIVAAVAGLRAWFADPLARGRDALASGDYRAARVDLLRATGEQPDEPGIRLDLARALNGLGRGAEAERQLLRARELGADEERLRVDAARALLVQGRAGDALAMLAGPIPAGQREAALAVAGEANYRLGRIDIARDAFAGAVAGGGSAESWIAVGRFRLAERDVAGADAAADEARRRAPRSVAAWALKADVVRRRGGPVAALAWYEAALQRDRDHLPTLLEYAAALGDAGRHRAMLDPLDRVAAVEPRNPRLLFLQAVLAARGGQPALARTLLDRIAGADAALPAVLEVRAAVELALDAPSAARAAAGSLVAMQPENRRARRLFALALAQQDDARGVIAAVDPVTTRPDADSWSLLLLSRAFSALGWHGDAAPVIDRAAALSWGRPSVAGAAREGGDSMDPAGAIPTIRARIVRGDIAAARRLADALARANPGVADAWLIAGDAALAADDARGAAERFRRAADLSYDEPAMLRLVQSLGLAGDRAAAGEALAAFTARWPESSAGMRVSATFAAEAGDWAAALAWLRAAQARIGPLDALLHAQIARALLELGDAPAALEAARRGYRLLPGNATVSGVHGLALARSGGDPTDARDLIAKAVQLAPDDATLRAWQADVAALTARPERP